jgi:hypothetical protein
VVGRGRNPALAQGRGDLLGLAPSGDVDDPGLRGRLHGVEQRAQLALGRLLAVEALDRQADVRPVEAADEDARVAHRQPLDDLIPDGRRRRGGEREDGRAPEGLGHRAELEVLRPEVVPPLGDAVGLVDDQQRRSRHGELGQHLLVGELLGSQEQELERVLGQLGERAFALGGGQGRVELRGAARRRRVEILDLVALEGDQR